MGELEDEREMGEKCQSCSQRSLLVFWMPDEIWAAISPKPESDGGGILCPRCADQLARAKGIYLKWTADNMETENVT